MRILLKIISVNAMKNFFTRIFNVDYYCFSLIFFSTICFADDKINTNTLVLNGAYQGKNLYVQNPFTVNMKDFCTIEVYVNSEKVMSQIKSSAYEIDLSYLAINEPLTIEIVHKSDCKPKVLNSQVIRLNSNLQFANLVATESAISWSTKGEKQGDKMYLEQFLYNTWINLKEIQAKGSSSNSSYSAESHHTSGINKYRIKYLDKDGTAFYSRILEFQSVVPEITFYPKRVSNKIYLSRGADYEITDENGTILNKGKGKEIPCETLKEGIYYLNIDNKTEKFLKK